MQKITKAMIIASGFAVTMAPTVAAHADDTEPIQDEVIEISIDAAEVKYGEATNIKDAEKEKEQTGTVLDEATKNLDEKTDAYNTAQNELDKANEDVTNKKTDLDNAKSEAKDKIDNVVADTEKEVTDADQAVEDAKTDITNKENDVVDKTDDVSKAEDTVKDATENLDKVKTDNDNITDDDVKKAEDVYNNAVQEEKDAQDAVTKAESDVNDAKAEVDKIQNDVDAKKAEMETATADRDAAQKEVDTAQSDVDVKKQALENAKLTADSPEFRAAQEAYDNALAILAEKETVRDEKQAVLDEKTKSYNDAELTLTSAETNLSDMEKILSDANSVLDSKKSMTSLMGSALSMTKTKRANIVTAETNLETANNNLSDKEQTLTDAKNALEIAKQTLTEKEEAAKKAYEKLENSKLVPNYETALTLYREGTKIEIEGLEYLNNYLEAIVKTEGVLCEAKAKAVEKEQILEDAKEAQTEANENYSVAVLNYNLAKNRYDEILKINQEAEKNNELIQLIDEDGNKYLLYPDGTHYTGWYDMQPFGELYFDSENNGAAVTNSTKEIDGKVYLFDENGVIKKTSGTPIVNGEKYWVQSDGTLGLGWLYLGNWKMYFDPETYAAKTVVDGVTDINGKKYLFNKDGVMQNYAGTTVIDGRKYWFSTDDASLKTGWLTLGDWKLYFDSETYECATGIKEIDGEKYLFDSNGILQTSGTPIINGKKYYIGEDNTLQSGWINIGNRKVYIDPNTYEMSIGIKEANGKKLIFDQNGLLIEGSGTFVIDGKKYAYDNNGNAITGWIKLGNWKMYFNPNTGVAAIGIVKIEGKDYLFDNNGVMQDYAGTTIINGKKYWFSTENASLKSGWLNLGNMKLYFDPTTYAAYTSTVATIDGIIYEFDSNGCVTKCFVEEDYFKSYEISDEIFARIYGDDKSFKTYCTVPRSDLRYIKLLHWGFDEKIHEGELIVNKAVAEDIVEIFRELYENKYQIKQMVLVDNYNADDRASIAANNTSAFNFRTVTDNPNVLSYHGMGAAIDINPINNPYVWYDANGRLRWEDPDADLYLDRYASDAARRHMINHNDLCYKLFIQHGWKWGGDWSGTIDYQHFEKTIVNYSL